MQFPLSMKAGRFLFSTEREYAGRLFNVSKRSIENHAEGMALLRLEFEIFLINLDTTPATYVPTGGIASRDLVITQQAETDPRLAEYAEYLGLKQKANKVASWKVLERKATRGDAAWIRIRFGPPEEDQRQPFAHISALEKPRSKQIRTSGVQKERGMYWRVSEVRQLLRNNRNQMPSEDTITRFVDSQEGQFKEHLVRRTPGGQREVNWYLCWHLWEANKYSN